MLAAFVIRTPLAAAQAPEASTIGGTVVDAYLDTVGVPGATVTVEGTSLEALTDDDGRFTLVRVPVGPVTLLTTAPDHAPSRVALSAADRLQPVVIPLTWTGAELVSVSLAPRQQPDTASTTRLSSQDISAAPRRNAEEVLRQVPGLMLVQHGSEGKGHQFFLRGFDAIHGADLELSLDGIPLNEWSNIHAQGYLDLGLIIPEMIDNVVVTKGPFTLSQGAFGMAGSADYRLGVSEDDLGWRAAYTIGTSNRHRLFAAYAPHGEDGQQFVGFEATHDDGFGDQRGLDRATFNARVRLLDHDTGGTLHLVGLGSISAFELPGTLRNEDVEAGRVGFYGAYDPETDGTSTRGLLALMYAWEQRGHTVDVTAYGGLRRLELLENFTGYLVDAEHGDRRDQFHQALSFGVQALHASPLTSTLTLRTGLGLRGDRFSQREDGVGEALEIIEERRDLDALQLIAHALTGLRWTPSNRVRVDAGARVDLVHVGVTDHLDADTHGQGTQAVVSPRITVSWTPVTGWELLGAYGRGFRPPEARAFSAFDPGTAGIGEEAFTGGDPATTVSDAFELGTRWSPVSWFGVNLSGFATFIERESVFDHVSGVSLELNGTRRLGGELVVQVSPQPWLKLSADVTVADARFVASGNAVPFAPRVVSGLRAAITHPSGFRAGFRVVTVAPRPLPHGATGALLVRTDATLGYHWRWLRVDLEVENLLNQQLREGEYHYASHWRPEETASAIPVIHTTAGPPLNARLTFGVRF